MKSEDSDKKLCDLCVIGSGPVGIIVALEYARLNPEKKILLVEYGYKDQGFENGLDSSIINMNPVNHHSPPECTNKGLGGSTATWGGRCVMYDEVDFIDRPIIKNGCTWDIDLFNEVNNYINTAAGYFECGCANFSLHNIPKFKNKRIVENFAEGVVTDSVLERWSMPTRFGKRYKKEIAACSNLSVIEAFEARDFSPPDANGNISTLLVRNVKDKSVIGIESKFFVLAAGAQETTRILLRNPQLFKLLGNVPDALGKYYQGHLSGKISTVRFEGDPEKTEFGFLRDDDGTYLRRRFQFSTDFLVKSNLLNTAIWLDNPLYYDPGHGSGAMSFIYLAMITPVLGKKLAPPSIAESITKRKINGVRKHVWNVVKDLPGSLLTPAYIFYKRYCLKRKLPGVFLYSADNSYALHFHAEQIPDADNRMVLDADGETLVIHYNLSDEDVNSVIRIHHELDSWLRKFNCGELEYWFKGEELAAAIKLMSKDGIHQSGTTRIADTPDKGVVDKNLKVWGTQTFMYAAVRFFQPQVRPTQPFI